MRERVMDAGMLWGWVRVWFCAVLLSGILGLWAMAFLDLLWPGCLSHTQTFLLCAFGAPLLLIPARWSWMKGFVQSRSVARPRREQEKVGADRVSVLVSLSLFGVWAGGYYGLGAFTAKGPMATLGLPFESSIPLLPWTSFVYVTVQWFLMLGIAVGAENFPPRRLMSAGLSTLFVCFLFFVCFPVTMKRDALVVVDNGTWVLSLIHSGDIAHNCFPSSHCAMALFSALVLARNGRWSRFLGFFQAVAIGISTLTTKQHYFLDVVGGFMIAGFFYWVWLGRGGERASG